MLFGEKTLDTRLRMRYTNKVAESGKHSAELCKGSTTDSDSVCEGSNPSSAATTPRNLTVSGFFLPFSILLFQNHRF